MLVGVFLLDFLSKNLKSNLINLNTCFRNIYKCIEIFHFLHKVRVFCRQDFLSKNLTLNLKRWNIYFRTICNKSLPY